MNGNSDFKLLFVINPGAGSNNVSWQEIISNYFTGKAFSIDYFFLTKEPGTEALKKIYQIINQHV